MSVVVPAIQRNSWWIVLLQGIATLVLGLLLVTAPDITLPVVVLFLGAYWLVSGLFSIIGIFVGFSRLHWGWSLFSGIIGIFAGIVVLNHPLISSIILPAVFAVVIGIQGIIFGFVQIVIGSRGGGWGVIVWGILSVIFGAILITVPLISGLLLVFILGFVGIFGGIAMIVMSIRTRRAGERATT